MSSRARERLELVVTMYIPAHRGGWVSAMADAAAKAGQEAARWDVSGYIRAGVKWRPVVSEVRGTDGEWEVWDARAYTVMREAMGWWVRKEEGARIRNTARIVEESELGPKWAVKTHTRWTAVWRETGASRPKKLEEDDSTL